MQPWTRRHFLGSAGAVAALQLLPGCATRRPATAGGSTEGLLARMAEQLLAEYPENATSLGLDKDGVSAAGGAAGADCSVDGCSTLTLVSPLWPYMK